jgi:hypothetical protein
MMIGAGGGMLGACGPFADVAADGFCSFVLEIFTLGITTGTSPTTYDPTANVSRLQMAAFLSRSVDGALRRGSPRTALKRLYTPQNNAALLTVSVGSLPQQLKSDGVDTWVPVPSVGGGVVRLRGTDGANLGTWSANGPSAILVAMGRVFAAGNSLLNRIDPTQPPGPATVVASPLGIKPHGIAYDGSRIWTANSGETVFGNPGGVSIVTPGATIPWTVTTLTAGFQSLEGILYDGSNIWVTDYNAGTLLKLDSTGAILQTVPTGAKPGHPAFDGTNIWVPSDIGTLTVVRASNGAVLQNLTGNGMDKSVAAAFDGQRILVTNYNPGSVSFFKAADLTALGSVSVSPGTFFPTGACSDGVSFWVSGYDLATGGRVVKF